MKFNEAIDLIQEKVVSSEQIQKLWQASDIFVDFSKVIEIRAKGQLASGLGKIKPTQLNVDTLKAVLDKAPKNDTISIRGNFLVGKKATIKNLEKRLKVFLDSGYKELEKTDPNVEDTTSKVGIFWVVLKKK